MVVQSRAREVEAEGEVASQAHLALGVVVVPPYLASVAEEGPPFRALVAEVEAVAGLRAALTATIYQPE